MKKLLFIATLSVLVFGMACNNDDDNNPVSMNDDCSVTYTIDGQQFTENDIVVCALLDGTLNVGLIGSNDIQLQVNNLSGPGTFTFPDDNVIILVDLDDGTRLGAEAGTITVSDLSDSKASGTFSVTLRDINDWMQEGPTMSLTNGQFSASY